MAGKTIKLLSPMVGVEPVVWNWPLKKGKGSLRRSEVFWMSFYSNFTINSNLFVIFLTFQDKQDEAAEIMETIR